MNITSINAFRMTTPFGAVRTQNNESRFGLTMPQPLTKDTVSFKGTPKTMASRSDGITRQLAKEIHEDAEKALDYLVKKIEPFLYDLKADSYNTDAPIEIIKQRAKSVDSIIEKSATRGWRTREEVKREMTDLAGMKIIMRDASKEQTNKVIDRLIDFVTQTGVKIVEIENKRPLPVYNNYGEILKSYDYASPRNLANLQKVASKNAGRNIRYADENTPTNYMAVHILTELPNGITGEIQIMGHDVAALKEIEDLCFKVKNGKALDKKYAPIEKALSPLKQPKLPKDGIETEEYLRKLDEHKALDRDYLEYTKEAYMDQREKEPRKYKNRSRDTFLKIPGYLPKELDFNYLYDIKRECDIAANQLKATAAKAPVAAVKAPVAEVKTAAKNRAAKNKSIKKQ